MLRTICLIGGGICSYAVYLQLQFLLYYFEVPDNPVRNENLEGALLVAIVGVVLWVGMLALGILKRKQLSAPILCATLIPSATVGLLGFSAVVIGAI